MPDLSPFRAITYSGPAGDPGGLLAPPYDVIGRAEAAELRERSPFNSVRLVLPSAGDGRREEARAREAKGGGSEAGDRGDTHPDAGEKYRHASRLLTRWLDDGILRESSEPGFYVYAQTFTHAGDRLTRHGLFGALRARPFSEGEVIPHEETHGAAKRDRLALMESCRAQLSPVFLIAPDGKGGLGELLRHIPQREPPSFEAVTPDGIEHRLWRVEYPARVEELRRAGGAEPLLIADGHHRYETALELARRHPGWEGADRVLACVVPQGDEGLLLLPTHRSLRRPPADRGWRETLEEAFEVSTLASASPSKLAERVAGAEASRTMAVLAADGDGEPWAAALRPRGEALAGADLAPPESEVPSLLLDRLLLRRTYGTDPDGAAEAGLLGYHRDPTAAAEAAGPSGASFLLPPMRLETVWAIAGKGGRLPPKSTYFWPKLPSGLLFRRL